MTVTLHLPSPSSWKVTEPLLSAPLVERRLRFELDERVAADGTVVRPGETFSINDTVPSGEPQRSSELLVLADALPAALPVPLLRHPDDFLERRLPFDHPLQNGVKVQRGVDILGQSCHHFRLASALCGLGIEPGVF